MSSTTSGWGFRLPRRRAIDIAKVGIAITVVGYAMLLSFAATYWRYLGCV